VSDKNENELLKQFNEDAEKISKLVSKADEVKFTRDSHALGRLLDEIEPLEEEIKQLQLRKNNIFDKITLLRNDMVAICHHPKKMLLRVDEGTYKCKFCNRIIFVPKTND
jgi:archaellum component FlaC